ncbi:two-component sensor histidine kinase [Sporanaerobium hydrogeniformans]|uniref:Two-component sensor histidine kinase n=1 Tax=Sporanaerobium hydrogeniformans TaxID=3072179 RepID=A0AC61DA37_9FIRM|nr:HAMP domain-containing sensor histidine kinase [Sporanaerobium hydrogeniformans]PHV69457.1 two-component sensor histidine kinase [Sporanaerobium hydrogeniformans]
MKRWFKKLLQFKSLTLRIWMTFIVFAGVIILALSGLYLGLFKRMEEANKLEAISIGHEMMYQILSKGNRELAPDRTINFKKVGQIHHILLKQKQGKPLEVVSIDKRPIDPPKSFMTIGQLFATYIKGETVYKETHKTRYDHQDILFMMSTLEKQVQSIEQDENLMLVSYITYINDNNLLFFILGIGFIFIIIALMVAKIISNYICNPLRRLEQQALKIANKEWVEPMKIESKDEIGRLIHSINYMQEALRHADQEERRFLQSISHDLKTPIMVIMAHAQAIEDQIYVESLENTAEIIKIEALRLENKVKQILYYNTLDYLLEKETKTSDLDLKVLLEQTISRFELLNKDIKWQITLESAKIQGNKERLQVAIENILDNQLRYAKEKIYIMLYKQDKDIWLEIGNDGPPIEDKDLPRIFEELYKDSKGKFGLGLAITKKIIVYYGGEISVVNKERGVNFKMRF